VNEDGQDLGIQSSLDLILVIGTDLSQGFQVYGTSDQRFKVAGGNAQVVQHLAARVADRIEPGHALEAIRPRGSGYLLTFFTTGAAVSEVYADLVILALPFSVLRHVAIGVSLPAIKQRVIRELGYGTNTKLLLGTRGRPWRD